MSPESHNNPEDSESHLLGFHGEFEVEKRGQIIHFQLINKSFDFGVLHHIKRTHRSIRMEVPGALDFRLLGEYGRPVLIGQIFVNGHCVEKDRMLGYLEFLRIVGKVKVQHLVMINLWAMVISYKKWKKELHDEIYRLLNNEPLQTLIGMHDLCTGVCKDCYNMARNPSVYECQPAIGYYLVRLEPNYHYKKLIINEIMLHFTAIRCSDGKIGTLIRKMFIRTNPYISCDQLCFKSSECLWKSKERLPTEPLPLEMIQRMCDVWEPDSILIEYEHFPQNWLMGEKWSEDGDFTPVRLDGLYEEAVKPNFRYHNLHAKFENSILNVFVRDGNPAKKERKFSSVTVDMTNTERIYKEVIDGSIDRNDSYSNLIANVRMLFPTDKIVIIGSSSPTASSVFNKQCFENIVKSVWKNRGRMEVTIQHELPISLIDNNFVIGDSMDMLGRRLNCTLVPERLTSRNGFIGRTYRITDNINEKTLNLELFVPRKPLEFLKNFY